MENAVQHLIEHLAMLRRHGDARVKTHIVFQAANHGRQLDRLRTGAEDEKNFQLIYDDK